MFFVTIRYAASNVEFIKMHMHAERYLIVAGKSVHRWRARTYHSIARRYDYGSKVEGFWQV